MNQDELKAHFRNSTAAAPSGARQRVWRALQTSPSRRRVAPLMFAFVAAVSAGVVIGTFFLRPQTSTLEWRDEHAVVVWETARASFDGTTRHVTLESGDVALSAWGGRPVSLTAVGHQVRVELGIAVVKVASAYVTVEPVEGVVWLDGAEMRARENPVEPASALVEAVHALEAPAARARRLAVRADLAVAEKRFEVAAQALGEVAELGTLEAEVALYKKGELELRELKKPEDALATFERGEVQFVRGALTQERQLSAIESCVQLERWHDVLTRTSLFLVQHSASERSAEVKLIHALALEATGQKDRACQEAAQFSREYGAELKARCP